MKREKAFLCEDCQWVDECSHICPKCGSVAVYPLWWSVPAAPSEARLLDGPINPLSELVGYWEKRSA